MAGTIAILSPQKLDIEVSLRELVTVSFHMDCNFRKERNRFENLNDLRAVPVFFQKKYNKELEDEFIDFSVFSENYQLADADFQNMYLLFRSSHLDAKIALDFCFHYLKMRPDNKVTFYFDKFYSYEDIERIMALPFNEGWVSGSYG